MKAAGLRNAGCNGGYMFVLFTNIVTQIGGAVNKTAGLCPLLQLDFTIKNMTDELL